MVSASARGCSEISRSIACSKLSPACIMETPSFGLSIPPLTIQIESMSAVYGFSLEVALVSEHSPHDPAAQLADRRWPEPVSGIHAATRAVDASSGSSEAGRRRVPHQ